MLGEGDRKVERRAEIVAPSLGRIEPRLDRVEVPDSLC